MRTLRAGVSVSSDASAGHVFDLPGCSYAASAVREVRDMLPVVAAEFAGWLARHGEAIDSGAVSIDIVEQVDAAQAEGVEGEFVFDDDLRPLTDDEIERALRWMQYSRQDLLSLIERVPDPVLDWRPPASSMARIDPWKPAPLTIREIVDDIASAEFYYRTSLIDGPAADGEPALGLTGLAVERQGVEALLVSLSSEQRSRVFAPRRPWQTGAERWTARKVVRRVLGHERFHTAEIQQRLTWVLLGAPSIRQTLDEAAD